MLFGVKGVIALVCFWTVQDKLAASKPHIAPKPGCMPIPGSAGEAENSSRKR